MDKWFDKIYLYFMTYLIASNMTAIICSAARRT